ncbi:hypothetical protein PGT21_013003 [Puccinia graminis f. sp. tritici]|uniref:Uncharacterized protein n=1 Tax=Puccinia graminis f. sp. tritici TaxID=56615 RepID=A0A5B0PVP7_PUCGR|nr:hypothetical protein PGT21_013003 [Puccinia graminis f. sp. tritici]KAA1104942.1 hypothetical protein PGTUg99_004672 [Puccinia graminis f. sp. tritici]
MPKALVISIPKAEIVNSSCTYGEFFLLPMLVIKLTVVLEVLSKAKGLVPTDL